ncbi:MAG TPA: adenylate/guanylate cyclase domain-containing protein [Anaerolineales bacterium]|nr:adenylate/guanylate cyclase domain-containing protein [Anaerolineales bacterium]
MLWQSNDIIDKPSIGKLRYARINKNYMNCPNCQAENPDIAKFCMNCGTSLSLTVGERDGTSLAEVVESTGEKSQFNLDRYLPQELITKLEAARSHDVMAGERRVITMLFCDVKGSTAAAEQVDPEIWTEIMNGIFEYMIRPIYKYEGFVPRLMGDAILAFFGAPITHEDDPQRAVLAGLEIQEGIKPYAEEIRLKHGLEFGLRVGINTGLVVVGEIGSDLRMEYTAIGDAINLAARMEQTARVGTIQISDETYKLVAPFFDVEPLGEVEVKGKSAPIETYRVLGVKSRPGQLRGLEGLSSPLVGRESQMEALKDRLKDLAEGAGSVVAVVGEAGLGKSTLIAELKKSDSRYLWLRGDSLSYTRSVSYHPWRQVIRQAIDAHEDDSPVEVRAKLGNLPSEDLPFLEAVLAVESEESAKIVTALQGDALNKKILETVGGFLRRLAKENPLVLVFDDLHWADEASLNLLLNVIDLNAEQPILFICMSRPDRDAAGWNTIQQMKEKLGDDFHSVDITPLQGEQTETLLKNLLGVNDLPKPIMDLIMHKAEGNPFFVEEIIRSLIETNQIVHENDHWRAVGDKTKITLPNTLRGVLSARIDRLPETPKHVLQNAAVIGRLFDVRILKRLTNLNGNFAPQIQYLKEASLIEAVSGEYGFRHVLVQEAAYESILIRKRTELHKQIAETMESLYENRIEEFAPLLAYHFYSAGDERSLKYDIIAGEKAARIYANAEAATHFNRALEVARRENTENDLLTSIFVQLGAVYELSGRYEQAQKTYKDMEKTSIERGDRSMELQALMGLATIHSTLTTVYDPILGENILKQALELAIALEDIPAQAKLHWNLMLNYLFSNRVEEALEHCEPTIDLARQVGDLDQLAFTLNDSGRVYQGVGAFEKAFEVFDEANKLWAQQDNQVMLADNLGASGMANYFAGNFDKALSFSEQAYEISKQTDNYWGQSYSRVPPVYVYFDRGLIDLAIRSAIECIETGEEGGLVSSTVLIPVELAWIYGLYGETSRGIEMAERALETANEKMPDWKSPALATLIRLHLLMGNVDAAERIAGSESLKPVLTVIRSRYLAIMRLTAIELELGRNNYQSALLLSDDLLEEIAPLGWINNPEILSRKADALVGLGRLEEALQNLTEACSLAEGLDAKHYLWTILASLADVSSNLGEDNDADKFRRQARETVEFIAEGLEKVDLKEQFLRQPRVKRLLYE